MKSEKNINQLVIEGLNNLSPADPFIKSKEDSELFNKVDELRTKRYGKLRALPDGIVSQIQKAMGPSGNASVELGNMATYIEPDPEQTKQIRRRAIKHFNTVMGEKVLK